jgi:hypothetical protein
MRKLNANQMMIVMVICAHKDIHNPASLNEKTLAFLRAYLDRKQTSDISPLVDNDGLSEGDELLLQASLPSSDFINVYTSTSSEGSGC